MTAPNQVPEGVQAPVPAEQVVQQASTTALADDAVAPEHFIPAATRDNYAQIARDQAAVRGTEPREVMQELADQFEQLHERQPLDGYDHLAAWARTFDPAAGAGPSGLAVLQARMIESARRDPYQAAIGDQALVEQAVLSQQAADAAAAGAAAAPSVDPASTGFYPNPGPLPLPEDAVSGPNADAPAHEQPQPESQPPPSAPSAGNTADTADASSSSSSSGGSSKGEKGSDKGSSS